MSEILNRDSTTDNYQILSSYTNTQSDAERSIVQALVQATLDTAHTLSNNIYTSPANTTTWNYTDLSDNYINTSAIFNYPNGTVTENSVIYVDLSQNDVSFNNYSTNISSALCNNNVYPFSALATSAPYYDSNYVVTQSINSQCYDDVSAVSFLFDNTNSNFKIQYAMQSRWNTVKGPYASLDTVGADPLALSQDVSFNATQAFGQQGTAINDPSGTAYTAYWSYVDPSNGSIKFNSIDPSNQPILNNLSVLNRDMTDVAFDLQNDVGIFRIQQTAPFIYTYLNGTLITDINENLLLNVPMFNSDGTNPIAPNTSKSDASSNLIPGFMTYQQFATLFNTDVFNTINNQWEFSIDISSNYGGYTIQTPNQVISNLDDSGLKDNLYYMQNYVNNNHHIDISSGDIYISPSTDGISDTASTITIDLSNGEVLDINEAGINGQIILNTNSNSTRTTDVVSVDTPANTEPLVYYPSDVVDPSFAIDTAEQTNHNFQVMWQKVAQNTQYAPPEDYLIRNNNALLTLYTNQIVDNSYNTTDFDLSFNSSVLSSTNINLWRINLSNNIIVDPNSFFSDANYTSRVNGISTLGVLTNILEAITYNNYRQKLTAKNLTDIALYNSVQSALGWSINYSSGSIGSILTTISDNAFDTIENLPRYTTIQNNVNPSLSTSNLINSGVDLSFNYTYHTVEDSISAGGLVDYVQVNYAPVNQSLDPSNILTNSFQISQSEITRNYTDSSYNFTPINDASYSFTGSVFNKTMWELGLVNANSTYNASFPAHYGPFNNITLSVNDIVQTDIYYAVRNKASQALAPQSALQYVNMPGITTQQLNNVIETIAPSTGNTLSITGIFTNNDLKPFTSVVEASDLTDVWVPLSDPISTDTYYGLNNTANIYDTIGGIVTTNIEYTPLSTSNPTKVSLSGTNYYVPFTIDIRNNSYSLTSFESAPSNLGSNTSLGANSFGGNTSYLTVQNNYSTIPNNYWSSTNYTSTIVKNGDDYSLTVNDLSGNTVFVLSSSNSTTFLATFIISYIPYDSYRADRLLGSVDSPTFQESFGYTSYVDGATTGGFGLANIPGVFITDNINSFSPSNSPSLGCYQSFRVLGDYMNIGYYANTSPPSSSYELGLSSYNNGSLTFQYTSEVYYSAAFTFPIYRGYGGLPVTDQYYTINRSATSVNFIVDASGSYTELTDNLTANMYHNQPFIVNELRNTSSILCADLNLSGMFNNYSILPYSIDVSYNVLVTGDTVNVTFTNPNYNGSDTNIPVPTDATPVVDPKNYTSSMTLKDYGRDNMYTFSGNWYLNNALMAVRPSRVKLTNAIYTPSSLNYYILFGTAYASLYKAVSYGSDISYNWLGNPSTHGSQNPNENPSALDWLKLYDITEEQLYTGINIGSKTVYQNLNLPESFRIVYIVSVPPYLKYEQISTGNCPSIPYNYNVDYSANETIRYYPYTGLTNTFNPFAATVSFTDISGNSTTITNNQSFLNNVTFTLQSIPTLTSLYLSPINTRNSAIVHGTNLNITLYSDLYSSTVNPHTIYNGPITSIPNIANIDTTNIVFRNRDMSGGIYFSLLQYPSDVGYPSGTTGYEQIFHTSNQSEWYNINMYIGNSAWFNNNSPITYFDFNTNGIFPTLYTVVDMNNPITQRNYRRVFKYSSPMSLDIDISGSSISNIQTFTMIFNDRQYCDIDISGGTFPSSGIWNYPTILQNTNIGNNPITWTTDASFVGSFAYMGWSFGNATTSTNMLVELLGVQDTQQKWTYITLDPFMKYRNQFGVSVGSVAWDGSVTAPLVETRVIRLNPGITYPILSNDNTTIEQYSESTLN